MSTQNTLNTVQDFLEWMEENTYWEVVESEQSDWGDGEYSYHHISTDKIISRYKDHLSEED